MSRSRILPLLLLIVLVTMVFTACSGPPKGSAEWYFEQAHELAEQGDFDEAIRQYSNAIDVNPEMAQAYVNRAAAYASKENYERAIDDCTTAIDLESELTLAYINRAYAYNALGQYDMAIIDCTNAIDLDRSIAEAYINRAHAYNGARKYNLAVADCNKVLEIADESEATLAYYQRGLAYKGLGVKEKAVEDLEIFLTLSTNPLWSEAAQWEIDHIDDEPIEEE